MADETNPYEPKECRICGKPVRVVQVTHKSLSGDVEKTLERRCSNPVCRRERALGEAP